MTPNVGFVLGTRPEIIKLAPVISALAARDVEHHIIHTNQHYSYELDALFFAELELEAAARNLHVGSGLHGAQTARMLERVESAIAETGVSHVVVQGDTNSTLAGALAAAKTGCVVAHVEAGLRSFDTRMPEEVNRRLVDHASDELFPPTPGAAEQLVAERVPGRVQPPTGNTIVDAVLANAPSSPVPLADRRPQALLTLHRPENVDSEPRLRDVLSGVAILAERHGLEVIFPVHPRTSERLERFGISLPDAFAPGAPTSFHETLRLQAESRLVLTDSGGLQEEACILGTPCITLRTSTERPETVAVGANVVAGVKQEEIVAAGEGMLGRRPFHWPQPLGDGHAGSRIADALLGETPEPWLPPAELAARP